jgi:hypothetical protein
MQERAMEQKPAVGRIVHYVAYGTPGGEFPAGVCRAAVVTEVGTLIPGQVVHLGEDGTQTDIGVCVMNPTGLFFNRGIPYDANRKPGTWHWPERV